MTEERHSRIEQRLVALTRDLILIPSIPSRPEDRRRCYEFVKNHVDSLEGVEVQEFEAAGNPSLVATPVGIRHPEVLMCAHLDVITHPDISFYKSTVENGRIIGPGAGDMKGALAILMELFREIHQQHQAPSLGLVVTSDEETGGEYGVGYLVEECGLRCGTAMIPDGGSLLDVTVEEKGILHMKVTCHGHPAHAARPWLGNNPIPRLMQALDRLTKRFEAWGRATLEDHWVPTCAITVIATENESANRIPADAQAALDIRFPPPHTLDSMLKEIRECLDPDMEIEPIVAAEATHLSPDPLYLKAIEAITGHSARLVKECGGSDARFLVNHGTQVLMSRPLVGNLHASDEWIEIQSMLQLYCIYEKYLQEKLSLNGQA